MQLDWLRTVLTISDNARSTNSARLMTALPDELLSLLLPVQY